MSNLIFQKSNANDNLYMNPLKFIDTLESSKHIVLYYENPKFGKKIEFRFIRNGLLKGESCIFATREEDIDFIKFEMTNDSINVANYTKRGLLKIFKLPDIMKHPDGVMRGAEEAMDKMFTGLIPPFRLVMRMTDKVNTEEQIIANLVLEQKYHFNFDKFDGLVLCTYDINEIPINTHGKWVEIILKNHHSAIFATGIIEEGIAFDRQQ
ncbi:MAG: MEDS domain-containing protein [Thermoproteota archaeon]|nr:MEDS domain-containing protein [Thermoproteota archaeon]